MRSARKYTAILEQPECRAALFTAYLKKSPSRNQGAACRDEASAKSRRSQRSSRVLHIKVVTGGRR